MVSSTGEGGADARRRKRCERVPARARGAGSATAFVASALLASSLAASPVARAADPYGNPSADPHGVSRGGVLDDSPDRYASVAASVSPDGLVGETFRTVPIPLARDPASGALLSRTGRPAPGTSDCRWPDEDTLAAILPVATARGSHASGVVFATDRVLTAAHAITDAETLFVRVDSEFRRADLLLLDTATDLAVLRVDTRGIAPLPIADRAPAERQMVWAVGYPREAGRTTSSGVFQRDRAGALHTSAPIDSGQSGGGLLACEHGAFRVLGMLRGYGAYRNGDTYVKLDNHSVSVAGATIHRVLTGSR